MTSYIEDYQQITDGRAMPTAPVLAPAAVQHLTVDDCRPDVRAAITHAILNRPRSLQTVVGPSELGTPCMRKLAYKVSRHGSSRPRDAAWRPTVGVAVHGWLEGVFREADPTGERWLVETRVRVGVVDGQEVWGTSDLYDAASGTVIDWKVVGPTTLKKRKGSKDVGDTYRQQLHLYGRGFADMGLAVRRVMIVFLPAAGELSDAVIWQEDYDESIALACLARADALAFAVRTLGLAAMLPTLPMVDDYCRNCDYRLSGSTDPLAGCPGIVPKPDMMTDLVPPKAVPA